MFFGYLSMMLLPAGSLIFLFRIHLFLQTYYQQKVRSSWNLSLLLIYPRRSMTMLMLNPAPVHGDINQVTLLQAEMMALLGALQLVLQISKKHKLPKDCLKIYTDCKNAIFPAKKMYQITARNIFSDDADVKAELSSTYKKVQKFVSILHVKSHQTTKPNFTTCHRRVNLIHTFLVIDKILFNVAPQGTYIYNLAHSIHEPSPPPKFHIIPPYLTIMTNFPNTDTTIASPPHHLQMIPHLPNAWATFYHPSERITSDCPNSFSKYTCDHIAESKISSSFCLNKSQMQIIEWRNFRKVLESHKRRKLIKMIHNHWPTNHREYEWDRSTTNKCQLCKQHVKTWDHVFQCQETSIYTIRKLLIDGIQTFLSL